MKGTRLSVDSVHGRTASIGHSAICHAIKPRQPSSPQCSGLDCEPLAPWSSMHSSSSSFLADFGARVTLERLYHNSADQEPTTTGRSNVDPVGLLPILHVQVDQKPPSSNKNNQNHNTERSPDYFANVGDAIRTLREDIPALFDRELNCKWACNVLPILAHPPAGALHGLIVEPCMCHADTMCTTTTRSLAQTPSIVTTWCSRTRETRSRASRTTSSSSGRCASTARSSSPTCMWRSSASGSHRTM